MALTLAESGLFAMLDQDRDQLVCDAYKAARGENNSGAGNEQFTRESVQDALDELYNRTVGQTLSAFGAKGFFTIADAKEGTVGDIVEQDMADQWFAAINS